MKPRLLSAPTRRFEFRVGKLPIQEISEHVVCEICFKYDFFEELELYAFSEAGLRATKHQARPTGRLARIVATQPVSKVTGPPFNRLIFATRVRSSVSHNGVAVVARPRF